MEKKTMGAFIAALRKASGMTQRQLAERLHVSDKAVSRWERDESAPDLSLIPALAEALGVTTDELLRGERIPRDAPESPAGEARMAAQLENAASRIRLHHGICTVISLAASVLGLLTALICNSAFQRATLGFFLSCIFYLGALVSILVSGILALSRLRGYAEEEPFCLKTRKFCIDLTALAALGNLCFAVFTLPLIVLPWDAYMGLGGDTWAAEGAAYLLIFLLIALPLLVILRTIGAWKRRYPTSEVYVSALPRLVRLAGKTLAIVLAIECCIGLGSTVFTSLVWTSDLATGKEFDNFEDFKAYIEAEPQGGQNAYPANPTNEENVSIGVTVETIYPGEDGDYGHPDLNGDGGLIRENIYGKDGEVLYTYRNPRDAVVRFQLNEDETDILRFWVYERMDWFVADSLRQTLLSLFGIAAILTACGGLLGYLLKRRACLKRVAAEAASTIEA